MSDWNPTIDRNPADFEKPALSFLDRWRALLASGAASILVVDISHYNGDVDFSALRDSGVKGIIMKCSESTTYKDTRFEENWQEAMAQDFAVMVYHFFRDKVAADEFDWFMSCAYNFLDAVDNHTAVALDVETNNGVTAQTRANRAFEFCRLAKLAGLKDGIMYFADEAALKAWLGQVEQPGYPFGADVTRSTEVRAVADSMAELLWAAPKDTGLLVRDAMNDLDDILWYFIGSGWVKAADVKVIDVPLPPPAEDDDPPAPPPIDDTKTYTVTADKTLARFIYSYNEAGKAHLPNISRRQHHRRKISL